MNKIRIPREYFGAAAELEVGGVLARSGCKLTAGPDVGSKKPDFFCERNGVEFFAEVKTLTRSEKAMEAEQTLAQVMAACRPFFPAGTIIRSLPPYELEDATCRLKEKASRVRIGSPQEVNIPDVLKVYLVHGDEPDRIRMYDKWYRAPENSDIQDNGGLSGPPTDRSDLARIQAKIRTFFGERQIPTEKMGVLFITGHFMIDDGNVETMVNGVLKHVNKLPNIPAVVLTSIRTFTLSPNRRRIKEREDYVDVDYRLAPYVVERVLVIKNRSCRFAFDHGIWVDMYAERNEFIYGYSDTPKFACN